MSGQSQASGIDQRAAPGYRADIDGLRAIAVLAVVGGHIGIGGLGGGFTGVDMFFVISGYLVGGAVIREVADGRFSLSRFYARRLRRIAPALLVMIAGTTLLMIAIALPDALSEVARSMLPALAFAANFYFYAAGLSYFSAATAYAPLLPLWSLAVEEQYYLLFPPLVLLLGRYAPRRSRVAILLCAVVSFAISVVQVRHAPTAAFYLMPSRAWELLLGALAAGVSSRALDRRPLRESVALGGLALSVLPFLLYRSATAFPGFAALPPCLGTAMLLVSGAHGPTRIGRLLSLRPAVFFGLISYSLYLWHWPILLAAELATPSPLLPRCWRVAVFAASILMGYLSWRFVERPARSSKISTGTLIRWVGAGSAALLCAAAALVLLDGLPQRFSPAAVRVAARPERPDFHAGGCFPAGWNGFYQFDKRACLRQEPGKSNILLIGDSHAAQYADALDRQLGPRVHLLRATASGCTPLLTQPANSSLLCEDMTRFLFEDYLPTHPTQWIIVGGAWTGPELPELARTLDWLRARGFRILLIGPGVRYTMPLPMLLALGIQRGDPALPERLRARDQATVDTAVEALAASRGIAYFSPYRVLCPGERCHETSPDGLPILYDQAHLSRTGAEIVARRFSRRLLYLEAVGTRARQVSHP